MSEQEQEYIEELESLLTIAKHPGVVALFKTSIAKAKSSSPQAPVLQKFKAAPIDKRMSSTIKIKEYGWDQTDKFIKIYISNVPRVRLEDVSKQFFERGFTVEVTADDGKMYSLTINDLLNAIIPDQSSVKVRGEMICVQLRKKRAQTFWDCLLGKEKKNSVEKDSALTDNDSLTNSGDPGAGLMKLMKKMYDEGDDDLKRTITKSWYEAQEKRGQSLED